MLKRYGSKGVAVSLSGASQRAFGPNPKRVWLYVSPPSGNRVTVAFGEAAVANTGIVIASGGPGVQLTYNEIGERIHDAVFVIGTNLDTVGLVETDGECPCRD